MTTVSLPCPWIGFGLSVLKLQVCCVCSMPVLLRRGVANAHKTKCTSLAFRCTERLKGSLELRQLVYVMQVAVVLSEKVDTTLSKGILRVGGTVVGGTLGEFPSCSPSRSIQIGWAPTN